MKNDHMGMRRGPGGRAMPGHHAPAVSVEIEAGDSPERAGRARALDAIEELLMKGMGGRFTKAPPPAAMPPAEPDGDEAQPGEESEEEKLRRMLANL